MTALRRRDFNRWLVAAAAAATTSPVRARQPADPRRPFIGDMHSHYTMFGGRARTVDLMSELQASGTTLLAWALVDDTPFTSSTGRGIVQVKEPAPGELWAYFQRRVARYDAELARFGVPKALTRADVDAALAGAPHVVMASESANFLEGQPQRLADAHAMGLRHLQLVHFIESPLADHQTVAPRHEGMTAVGLQVIRECRRVGLLVDLAHCAPSAVDAAIAEGDAAMVWSHSWVRNDPSSWRDWPYIARALSVAQAKRFAARGGVIGLWTARVRSDRAYTVRDPVTYADEIARMVDLLGPRAVAFGTDMDGAGRDPVMSSYTELREVADHLARRNWPDAVLHDVCIGNYARVLRQAMVA